MKRGWCFLVFAMSITPVSVWAHTDSILTLKTPDSEIQNHDPELFCPDEMRMLVRKLPSKYNPSRDQRQKIVDKLNTDYSTGKDDPMSPIALVAKAWRTQAGFTDTFWIYNRDPVQIAHWFDYLRHLSNVHVALAEEENHEPFGKDHFKVVFGPQILDPNIESKFPLHILKQKLMRKWGGRFTSYYMPSLVARIGSYAALSPEDFQDFQPSLDRRQWAHSVPLFASALSPQQRQKLVSLVSYLARQLHPAEPHPNLDDALLGEMLRAKIDFYVAEDAAFFDQLIAAPAVVTKEKPFELEGDVFRSLRLTVKDPKFPDKEYSLKVIDVSQLVKPAIAAKKSPSNVTYAPLSTMAEPEIPHVIEQPASHDLYNYVQSTRPRSPEMETINRISPILFNRVTSQDLEPWETKSMEDLAHFFNRGQRYFRIYNNNGYRTYVRAVFDPQLIKASPNDPLSFSNFAQNWVPTLDGSGLINVITPGLAREFGSLFRRRAAEFWRYRNQLAYVYLNDADAERQLSERVEKFQMVLGQAPEPLASQAEYWAQAIADRPQYLVIKDEKLFNAFQSIPGNTFKRAGPCVRQKFGNLFGEVCNFFAFEPSPVARISFKLIKIDSPASGRNGEIKLTAEQRRSGHAFRPSLGVAEAPTPRQLEDRQLESLVDWLRSVQKNPKIREEEETEATGSVDIDTSTRPQRPDEVYSERAPAFYEIFRAQNPSITEARRALYDLRHFMSYGHGKQSTPTHPFTIIVDPELLSRMPEDVFSIFQMANQFQRGESSRDLIHLITPSVARDAGRFLRGSKSKYWAYRNAYGFTNAESMRDPEAQVKRFLIYRSFLAKLDPEFAAKADFLAEAFLAKSYFVLTSNHRLFRAFLRQKDQNPELSITHFSVLPSDQASNQPRLEYLRARLLDPLDPKRYSYIHLLDFSDLDLRRHDSPPRASRRPEQAYDLADPPPL